MKQLGALLLCLLGLSCSQQKQDNYQGYAESELVFIASPSAGQLIDLTIQRGQRVSKGQRLFTLDKNPQLIDKRQREAQVEQNKFLYLDSKKPQRQPKQDAIKAQFEQIKADIVLAKLRVFRNKQLYRQAAVDKDRLDQAIALLKKDEAILKQYQANYTLALLGDRVDKINALYQQLLSAKESLALASWQLEQKSQNAPVDGIVFDTYYRAGEYVNATKPVLSLLSSQYLDILFFIPVPSLDKIKVGQRVTLLCEGCSTEQGRIYYIAPQAEYTPPLVYSRQNNPKLVFKVRIKPDNPEHFQSGQPVVVKL